MTTPVTPLSPFRAIGYVHRMVSKEIYPLDTVVRIKKTGELALIRSHTFLKDGRAFLHYLGIIEGRGDSLWALYHDDIELERLPSSSQNIPKHPSL